MRWQPPPAATHYRPGRLERLAMERLGVERLKRYPATVLNSHARLSNWFFWSSPSAAY